MKSLLIDCLKAKREQMQAEVDEFYKNCEAGGAADLMVRAADRVMGFDEAIKIVEEIFNVEVLSNNRRRCEDAQGNAIGRNPMDTKGPIAGQKNQ